MIVSIFAPHAFQLVFSHPIGVCKRKCCFKRYKSQHHLNLFYRGSSFRIAQSLATVLSVVFTNFLYSAGMPILNVFLFCTLLLCYWCNKFLILRFYRRPPVYSFDINSVVINVLPFAVIFHSIFAIFAFGASDIFPTSFSVSDQTHFIVSDTVTIQQRCTNPSGINYICLIFFAIIVIIFINYYDEILKKFRKNNKVEIEKQEITFAMLKAEKMFTGIDSYNIFDNPKYKKLITTLNSVAKKKKKLIIQENDSNLLNYPSEKAFSTSSPKLSDDSSWNNKKKLAKSTEFINKKYKESRSISYIDILKKNKNGPINRISSESGSQIFEEKPKRNNISFKITHLND